jgi:hypothetical protein
MMSTLLRRRVLLPAAVLAAAGSFALAHPAPALTPPAPAAAIAAPVQVAPASPAPYTPSEDAYLGILGQANLVHGDGDRLVELGHLICDEGIAHGVPGRVILSGLEEQGRSAVEAGQLYAAARASFCWEG